MRYKHLVIASVLTAAGLGIVAAIALERLPAGAQLPVHWGPDGRPDRLGAASVALFMPVALTLLLSLVMAALPSLEPLQDRLDKSAPLFRTTWAGMLGILALLELLVAAPSFGLSLPDTTMLAAIGVLLMALGNVMPKSRPGFFVGIRTPWTITDPDNWVATHRFGGRLFIVAGAALVLLAVLPIPGEDRASCVVALLLVIVAAPVIYSFFLWRRAARA